MSPSRRTRQEIGDGTQPLSEDLPPDDSLTIHLTSLERLKSTPGTQVITRRISLAKLTSNGGSRYYGRIKSGLRNKMDQGMEVFINLIPDSEINERWILRTILTLQRELTPNIIVPSTSIEPKELQEWISFFRPRCIVQIV